MKHADVVPLNTTTNPKKIMHWIVDPREKAVRSNIYTHVFLEREIRLV